MFDLSADNYDCELLTKRDIPVFNICINIFSNAIIHHNIAISAGMHHHCIF